VGYTSTSSLAFLGIRMGYTPASSFAFPGIEVGYTSASSLTRFGNPSCFCTHRLMKWVVEKCIK
jgi:hypothetical protein